MFRKTLLSAMTAVILCTTLLPATSGAAFASDFGQEVAPVGKKHKGNRGKDVAAGAVIGFAAAVIGAAILENGREERAREARRERRERRERFAEVEFDGEACFDKPVRRFDPDIGRKVVVGYRTVCR
ncbi:hypothetical protein [Ensifer soli]|uniref:hypothetical protein n=1 Tax=Ciceribacter sp. sgz301302 TaxID=3342379 RepID=UPI0035B8A70B